MHHRRSIRLKGYDYNQDGAYFVTICTRDRECLFGDIVDGEMRLNEYGQIIVKCWNDLPKHYQNITSDEFIVMPNHMHGIVVIGCDDVGAIHELPLQNESGNAQRIRRRKMVLPKIIGRLKMNSSKQINIARNAPGMPIWQRNYYEHIIRSDEEMNRIREYIINNPAQWAEDEDNPVNIRVTVNLQGRFVNRPCG